MDAISDLFELLHLRGTFYFRTHFSAPWGTTVPRLGNAARFHYVLRGTCWASIAGGPPIELKAGDFLMVPHGASHILADKPVDTAPPLEDVLEHAGYDGRHVLSDGKADGSAPSQLICGHFDFDQALSHPLLEAFPDYMLITPAQRESRPWFEQILQLLIVNVFSDHPGSVAVVTRLSEILFIESLHCVEEQAPDLARFVKGFADRRLGRALAAMHAQPEKQWEVETLAREAGMSRTRFASEFHELFGQAPIAYLTEWRMQRAAAELRRSNRKIAEIAFANGYASAAAFSRAFRTRFGKTPSETRRIQGKASD